MRSTISFVLDGGIVSLDFSNPSQVRPTTTVLNYLRSLPNHKGTKRGCDEGDCGACTVALGTPCDDNSIRYTAIDSCLLFLPMIHGKHLVTVENLRNNEGELHPVQDAMVENHGSQCGFCTPGIVMSLFAQYNSGGESSRKEIDDTLTGNLCRCTGYRSIVDAAHQLRNNGNDDYVVGDSPRIATLLKSIPKESVQIQTSTQRYYLPSNLSEALTILHQNPNIVILSGATDIALRVTKRYELIPEILDISHLSELKNIKESGENVEIGSGVVLQDVLSAVKSDFPALHSMLSVFGSKQIRNLATLGGNLGTASPISDTLPVLMAYNARVVVASVSGKREIPLDEYVIGYRKTTRKPDELITSVILPKCAHDIQVRSYKIAKRRDFDIATVSGGFRLMRDCENKITEIKLAYGGMADRTKRSSGAEQFLTGKIWNRENIEEAMQLIEKDFNPISDVRASAEMRRVVAKNLLLKFWSEIPSNGNGK